MGYWITLHLFDDQKFHQTVVPELKGMKGDLAPACLEFIRTYTLGGVMHLSKATINKRADGLLQSVHSISHSFDAPFKIHAEYEAAKDRQHYISELEGYFDFCMFFEFYLFKTCADFFPYVPLGKGGLSRNFNLDFKSLAFSILGELDGWNEFTCGDMMGIKNWLGAEDIELLYLDKENLHVKESSIAEGILSLLEIAYQNKLGFIVGVDMRDDRLEQLLRHKLIHPKVWKIQNTKGLLFHR